MLCLGSQGQYILSRKALCREHFAYGEFALGQCAGLVKDHGIHFRQCVQVVAALYQNAVAGTSADAPKVGQRHGDHQRARAGYYQKYHTSANPLCPSPHKQRRHKSQGCRQYHHHRGVEPGENGDKILRRGFFGSGVFHKINDFCGGGLPVGLRHRHSQSAGQVDTAGQHCVSRRNRPGQRLSRQRRGVQFCRTLQHQAVQWHSFTGGHQDGFAHSNLLRADLHRTAPQHRSVVGTDVHQLCNAFPGAAHGHGLKILAHLIKEHHRHSLMVFPHGKCAHGCQRHKEILVKNLSFQDVLHRLPYHIPAADRIGGNENGRMGQRKPHRKQPAAQNQTPKFPIYLLVFGGFFFLPGGNLHIRFVGVDDFLYLRLGELVLKLYRQALVH